MEPWNWCDQVLVRGMLPRAWFRPRWAGTVIRRILSANSSKRSGREQGTVRESHPRQADFEFGYRIVHPDKGVRDIHVVGHAIFDRSGDIGEFVGTVIDVTERKRAEKEL